MSETGRIIGRFEHKPKFSFSDCFVSVLLPWIGASQPPVTLPNAALVSISEHRDTYPVTSLGNRGILGYVSGHRIVGGSLGFTTFGSDPFLEVLKVYSDWMGENKSPTYIRPDELPPFDLILTFSNPDGDVSNMVIKSLKVLDSSASISIDNIRLSHAYSWMAAGVTSLTPVVTVALDPYLDLRDFSYKRDFYKQNRYISRDPAPQPTYA